MTKIDLNLFTGKYKTDPYGNIYGKTGKILAKNHRNGTYPSVRLVGKDGKSYNVYSHRLIYHQQKGEIPDNMTINHIDGNPNNNHIDNLELLSITDNNIDSAIRRAKTGSKTLKMSQERRLAASKMYDEGKSLQEIADFFQVTVKTIRSILAGQVWGFDGNPTYKELMSAYEKRGDNTRKIQESQLADIIERSDRGMSDSQIAQVYAVHRSTINRLLRANRRKRVRENGATY